MNHSISQADVSTGGSVSTVENESKRKCRTCGRTKPIEKFREYSSHGKRRLRKLDCRFCESERIRMIKLWRRHDEKHQLNNHLLRDWK